MKPIALTTLLTVALTTGVPSYAGTACEVKSGPATAALVELYTSEGCSSCPPADRELNRLPLRLGAGAAVVPLALHVSYWDDLGWKDAFDDKTFDRRQSDLVAAGNGHVVYTPQFFVNGGELRGWGDGGLADAIRRVNARPATVDIALRARAAPAAAGVVSLDAAASGAGGMQVAGDLYVAVTESGLTSRVLRGENGGATLHHDDVVRRWYGPVALARGKARLHAELIVPAGWDRRRLRVAAFVQAPHDGAVLQAVDTAPCVAQ